MRNRKLTGALLGAVALACVGAAPASALNIVLHADSSFTDSPDGAAALLGFQKAANYWNKTLTNDVTLNFDIHFGALDDGILGGTYSNGINTSTAKVYAGLKSTGNSALDAVATANLRPLSDAGGVAMRVAPPLFANGTGLNNLAGSIYDNNDTYNNKNLAVNTSVDKAIGVGVDMSQSYFASYNQQGANLDVNADADITFSSNFDFDFNPTDGIDIGAYDFIGVATHEMGHALGFVSGVDDYDYYSYPNGPGAFDFFNSNQNDSAWGSTLDLFRYGINAFAPDGSRALQWDPGREAFFSVDGSLPFNLGSASPGLLATGAYNGDGSQASHWKDAYSFFDANGCVTDINPIGIMDPTIGACVVDAVSGNDIAAMDALGWNVNFDVLGNKNYSFNTAQIFSLSGLAAVPEPATWTLMVGGFGLVGTAVRRRREDAVAA